MQQIKIILITVFLTFTCLMLHSQPPPPPGNHSSSGNEQPDNGGGAPIGSGLAILALLAAGYGTKKYFEEKKEIRE